MKKSIIIDIPTPCSQSIAAMQQLNEGKFCTHCNQKVIDFTQMSNEQLFSFFNKNNQPVCGIFFSNQLNQPLHEQKTTPKKWYYFIALFISFLFQNKSSTQIKQPTQRITINQSTENTKDSIQQNKRQPILYTIKGNVIDSLFKKPVAGASVIINNTKTGAVTDSYGNFIIHTDKPIHTVVLRISGVGYNIQQIVLNQYAINFETGLLLQPLVLNPAPQIEKEPFITILGGVRKKTTQRAKKKE